MLIPARNRVKAANFGRANHPRTMLCLTTLPYWSCCRSRSLAFTVLPCYVHILTGHRLVIERDLDRVVSRLAGPKGHAEPGATEGLHLGGHVDPGWRGDEDLEVALPGFPRVHC